MDMPSASTRELARQLLAAAGAETGAHDSRVLIVNDKLRLSLTRFAGMHGFASLLRRALALASMEIPSLAQVRVTAEGQLEGFEVIARLGIETENAAGVAVTAHLLWLLVTFVGEPLTWRLVREAWPGIQAEAALAARERP